MQLFKKLSAVLLAAVIVYVPGYRENRTVKAAAKPFIKKAIPATCLIVSYYKGSSRRKGIGTGFVIHPNGYLGDQLPQHREHQNRTAFV